MAPVPGDSPKTPAWHIDAVRGPSTPVAVGTCVSSRAPRTEPYVRLSRIRLPPWVCDGEAIARPRMKDDRFREPGLRPLRHPYPCDAILVAATPQRAPPEVDDMVPEHGQCTGVGWHCVIAEVATNDVPQPFPLIGEWLVHALPQLLFDHPQLRPHAISPGLPFDLEVALAGLAADEGEAQEAEGLRSAEPTPLAAFRRKASELDEPRLLGLQCQRERPSPLTHPVQGPPSVALVLEADDEVVGVAHDDHVARGLAPSPAHGPQIERVVQVDVG